MAVRTNFEDAKGNSYYRIVKVIGHNPDGTPIKKQFYGKGKQDAIEKADKFMQDLQLGLQTNNGYITVNTLFPKWLFQYKKNELKRTTFEKYEGLYRNYIKRDLICNRPINEIKSIHIQQLYERLKKKKQIQTKRPISSNQIKNIHKLLHLFFTYVEKEGYILRNPCNNVSLPKTDLAPKEILKKNNKFEYFTEEEMEKIIKQFENSHYKNIVIFAYATGMRQGEILGLQWSDLDFENRLIHIIHNLSNSADFDEKGKRTYSLKVQTPKSNNSIRTIPMCDTVYNMLINKERKCDIVFSSKNNTYICNKNLLKVWQRKLRDAEIPYRPFHDIRHTFATHLLLHGANLVTIKELLGHSSIKITEIYLQALPETKSDTLKEIDKIIDKFTA